MLKSVDIRRMSNDERRDKLSELLLEALNLRFQKSNGRLENTARLRYVSRDIARLKTIMHEERR